jgi:exopolysaccharide biosynthesis protein
MMKNILWAGAILAGVWVTKQIVEVREVAGEPRVLSQTEESLVMPTDSLAKKIGDYKYVLASEIDPAKLRLIANYSEQLPASDLYYGNSCEFGINGGFYDTGNKPLGLLILNRTQLANKKTSKLFNGFAFIQDSRFKIQDSIPDSQNISFGVQSGPILMSDGEPANLAMASDKPARRVIMGNTKDGMVVFLSIFDATVENLGPYLAELPSLVEQISKVENISLESAINMDGGRASAFYSRDASLAEVEPVGSFWCAK